MRTINEMMEAAPALDNTNGATLAQALSGTTYRGLPGEAWGPQTAQSRTTARAVQSHRPRLTRASRPVTGPRPIRCREIAAWWRVAFAGVNLFRWDGTLTGGAYCAPVLETGQTECRNAGVGQLPGSGTAQADGVCRLVAGNVARDATGQPVANRGQ